MAKRYLNLLRTEIKDLFNNSPAFEREEKLLYQMDGSPAHCTQDVHVSRAHLNLRRQLNWEIMSMKLACRSPDLTPLESYFWEHIKSQVFLTQVKTRKE